MYKFLYSLEVDLLLEVKSPVDLWVLHCIVSRRFVNGECQVGDCSSQIHSYLALPVGIVCALVNQLVVSFEALFNLWEDHVDITAWGDSVHVHWHWRIVRTNACFDYVHGAVEVSRIFENIVDLFVFIQGGFCLLKISEFFSWKPCSVWRPGLNKLLSFYDRL